MPQEIMYPRSRDEWEASWLPEWNWNDVELLRDYPSSHHHLSAWLTAASHIPTGTDLNRSWSRTWHFIGATLYILLVYLYPVMWTLWILDDELTWISRSYAFDLASMLFSLFEYQIDDYAGM